MSDFVQGSVEGVAHETANNLLMAAVSEVSGFAPPRLDEFPVEGMLAAAHAVVAKLDSIETTMISLFSRQAIELSDHEKEIVYRALEADLIARGDAPNIEAMDAALARFKAIAGL